MALARVWWTLVRFGFRLLYNEMAWTYDLVSWVVSLGAWRSWQRAAIRYLNVPPGTCVLELAHGTGNLQIDMLTAGLTAVGLDLSPYMGRIARRKLARLGIRADLVRGRGEHLPFPAGAFPAVVSTFPTEFIIAAETLREVYRVLQPDGRLVIVGNGRLTGGGIVAAVLEWAYRVTGQRAEWSGDLAQRFTGVGFRLWQAEVPCCRSVAFVLVAKKPAVVAEKPAPPVGIQSGNP
ncbi:MAG: class I SAM-dependent methyltransferase [Anaerolineae bacterium]|nr:class I SAM-dependent methyltransferase [Anaerolineae bacterium]